MLGGLILASQIAMQSVPGVQLVGVFIAVLTLTYRVRALIPIYVYILLYCLIHFNIYSLPYLYIWLPLWAVFMLIEKIKSVKIKVPLSMLMCGLYGLSFGLLYAPVQMLIMSWGFDMIVKWWLIGFFTADITHAVNNLVMGVMIVPLSKLLKKLDKRSFL
jgi:energy-coupling factor transport system substrate-specific component